MGGFALSEYQHIAVRHEDVESVGTVTVANLLSDKLLDELLIRETADELLAVLAGGPKAMIVSFERVQSLSSSAIGQLVRLWKQSKAADIRLVLAELNETILEGFAVTHLDKQFEINTTEKRALKSLAFPVE